jgi:hypothetical protein
MQIDPTFPTKLDTVSDLPEPLRTALQESLPAGDSVSLLVHSAAFPTGDAQSPANVLAVTNNGWFVASETGDGAATLEKSDFNEILFLELRSILLLGQLRISYGADSSVTIQFDAVGDEYYCEVIELLLAGIDPAPAATAGKDPNEASMFEGWPMKFRNEAKRYWPSGQRLLAAVRWLAVFDNLHRQIAPAGALLITRRELVLISDEKESSAESSSESASAEERETRQTAEPLEESNPAERTLDPVIEKTGIDPGDLPGDVYEFSETVTFIPRVRLADFHLRHGQHYCILALQIHGPHGEAKLEIAFPSDAEPAVLKAMEQWPR